MDSNGFSDPYIKLHLLPDATKSTQLTSKVIPKTLNPEWNEKLTYYGICEDELLKKTLRITVLDMDKFGHDFLGETRVQLKRLTCGTERKFNVYLEKQLPVTKNEEAALHERGKIFVSLCYAPAKNHLEVGILRCAELLGMDPNGYSDPYVRVWLKPDKKQKYKTQVVKKNCNPVFDKEFKISCSAQDLLSKRTLEITVYDKDVGKHDDYIGGLQFSGSAKGERYRHWNDILKTPGKKIARWYKLSEEAFDAK